MQRIFWCLMVTVLASSCVPNKRIVYLQNTVEPKPGEVRNADTTARTYQTHYKEYVFKPRDIISLNIASITPQEFDFVKKYEEQLGLIRKLSQYDQANAGQRALGNMGVMGGGGSAANTVGGLSVGISPIALDQMQTGFSLDEEGYLELPYIGKLKFSGLTIPASEALVREKLKGYFETPVVRIQLLSFFFTILGEVNKEGRYVSYSAQTTIIDALAIANNLTDFADRSKLKVIRMEGSQAKVLYVNTLSEDLLGQPGYYLQPDDIIIVAPLQARATRRYTLPNYTTAITLITSSLTFLIVLITLNK